MHSTAREALDGLIKLPSHDPERFPKNNSGSREGAKRPTHTPPVSRVLRKMSRLVKIKDEVPDAIYWAAYEILRDEFYRSKAWRDLSRQARRLSKRCFFCGARKKLHAHHVVYLSVDPLRGLDITNLLIACKEHHMKIHAGMLIVPHDYPRLTNG